MLRLTAAFSFPDVASINVQVVDGWLVGEGAPLYPVDGEAAQGDVVHQEPGEPVVLDLVHPTVLQ